MSVDFWYSPVGEVAHTGEAGVQFHYKYPKDSVHKFFEKYEWLSYRDEWLS